MSLLIKNGYIYDPASKTEGVYDILIENKRIVKIAKNISNYATTQINAKNKCIMPGFIDMHVHLRDPGQLEKEDIASGSRAAVHGGFTTICAMPNTVPAVDCADVYNYVKNKSKDEASCNVIQLLSMTKGLKGKEGVDLFKARKAGVIGISEDGASVTNARVLYEEMRDAAKNDILVLDHCEDIDLRNRGVINQGSKAVELDLRGIPNIAEDSILARDLEIAYAANARYHACHCSTKDSVRLIKWYKELSDKFSAEVTPHHFTLSDDDIPENDGNYKMNPPLRSKEDIKALKEGLRDGIIDVIATDHAPHTNNEKFEGFNYSAFGIVGLETALSLALTELVDEGYLTMMQLAEKMSYNPAKILKISRGRIAEGSVADLVIFDKDEKYTIDKNQFYSKSRNTPFNGRKTRGVVYYTIIDGRIMYSKQ